MKWQNQKTVHHTSNDYTLMIRKKYKDIKERQQHESIRNRIPHTHKKTQKTL